jgi:hypothetical protein
VAPHALYRNFPITLYTKTVAELLRKVPTAAVLLLDMLCEQAKYSNPSTNKAVCSQYNVGVMAKVRARRTGNSSSIIVGGKRFFFPGRRLADRNWDPNFLFDWKGRLITWGYSGRSVNLITYLCLVLRTITNIATSAPPHIPFTACTGVSYTLIPGTRFQNPCEQCKSANN